MATTAETIVNDVSELLQDINKTRWSDAVLMRWLSEAELLIATHKPDAVATLGTISLVSGIDQSIPTDGMMILRIRRNASGVVVQIVDEDMQNRSFQAWPDAAQTLDVEVYMYDPKIDPLRFMVSPPNNGSGVLSVVYAKIPTTISATTANISVSDTFVPLLADYIMYRALMMETEGQNLNRSSLHLQTFLQGLGLNTKAYSDSDPNKEVESNG